MNLQDYSGPFSAILNSDCLHVPSWTEHVRSKANKDEFNFFVTALWSIWFHRNLLVNESDNMEALDCVFFVQQYLNMYLAALTMYSLLAVLVSSQEWCPPALGFVKVNDASLKSNHQCIHTWVVAEIVRVEF